MSPDSNFQARSVSEGRQAQNMACSVLQGCGFEVTQRNFRHPDVGATINAVATDQSGTQWFFDVSGSFQAGRPGLQRTDTLWKTLGRANVLSSIGIDRLVFMTTNLPGPTSAGGKALRAASHSYFDAVEMLTNVGRSRLRAYASGHHARPLPGFLTPHDVYGDELKSGGLLGADFELPLATVGDPLGQLHSDYEIRGLHHRFKVVVPSRNRRDVEIPKSVIDDAVEKIRLILHDHGGGCTTQQADGTWTDPLASVVAERVQVIETYADKPFTESVVRPIVETVLNDLDQAVAAVTLDDKMLHFNR